jgi:hypothetical protein
MNGACSITADSAGVLHAAWSSKNATYPNSFNIRYSKSTDGGATWATPTQINTNNSTDTHHQQPCIVIRSDGNPTILWAQTYPGALKIKAVNFSGSAWSAEITVHDGVTYVQAAPCAVVDSSGAMHVSWKGYDATDTAQDNLRYSKSTDNGATWATHTKLTSGNTYGVGLSSIAVDGANNVYIVWYQRHAGSTTYAQIRKIVYSGGSWGAIANLTSATGNQYYPQVLSNYTLFTDPLIVWQNNESPSVKFRGVWTEPGIEPGIDQYTKLLLHGDGTNGSTTFTDSEILAKTVTRYGNAQISTAQSVFGGASMLFDGTGDYLTVPDSDDWLFGTGDFTIDMWVRIGSYPATTGVLQYQMLVSRSVPTPTRAFYVCLWNNAGTYSANIACYSTTAIFDFSDAWAYSLNTWYHIAWVRAGNTIRFYVNGTQTGTDHTTAASVDVAPAGTVFNISGYNLGASPYLFTGYIDELRVSKGIARWTANFTPPTQSYALPGIDSYTKLALHMDGADSSTTFTDSCAVPKTVTRYGDAQIKVAQSKFGGASGYFDGTGDYIEVPYSSDFSFGAGDFTIDFWINFSTTSGTYKWLFDQRGGINSYYQLAYYSADTGIQLSFTATVAGVDVALYKWPYTPATATWYHMALVRSGSSLLLFASGVSVTPGSVATSIGTKSMPDVTNIPFRVGYYANGGLYPFHGYFDEFRISKGIARWTANFTPPDRAYENQDASGQLIPAISTATAASQLQVTTAGALNTYGATSKRYSGFVSKTEVGTI